MKRIKYLIIPCLVTGMVFDSYHGTDSNSLLLLVNIYQSTLRLFFDILHGIKRMDVPLLMVIEFMVFLGYDGKLETNSDMEKELFLSAIDQFKERLNIKITIRCIFFQLFQVW